MKVSEFGMSVKVGQPYARAVEMAKNGLKQEGFGVLTEVDVRKTMKEKLDLDFSNYLILGVCNPPLAHRALSADPFVGLMLPCNVVVFEEEGGTVISAMDPVAMMAGVENEELKKIAAEARARLERALDSLR